MLKTFLMLHLKNHALNKPFFSFCFALALSWGLQAQVSSYALDETSAISIKGTSTFHDWTATVGEFSGTLELGESFEAAKSKTLVVDKASLQFQVVSIDGGRGAAMNKKIKAALKSTEHPAISFEITQAQKAVIQKSDEGGVLQVSGKLAIAGVSKDITLSLTNTEAPAGTLAFVAEYPMKLSDFEMEPPSAMFGQIVTGDDITIVFDLKFASASN